VKDTYFIFPGNIAASACVRKHGEDKPQHLIYMEPGRVVRNYGLKDTDLSQLGYPKEVEESVHAHFKRVFDLPVEKRGEYIDNLEPWEVQVESTPAP
jgi:hypothetical protein